MSFESMKVADLRKVAEAFGVETAPKASKEDVIAALAEDGINYDMYSKFSEAESEELPPAPKKEKVVKLDKSNSILVRMDRSNPTYSVGRYVFTQEHPFVAMSESDAQAIFDSHDGFRPATPREVHEFYG